MDAPDGDSLKIMTPRELDGAVLSHVRHQLEHDSILDAWRRSQIDLLQAADQPSQFDDDRARRVWQVARPARPTGLPKPLPVFGSWPLVMRDASAADIRPLATRRFRDAAPGLAREWCSITCRGMGLAATVSCRRRCSLPIIHRPPSDRAYQSASRAGSSIHRWSAQV